LGRAGLQMGFTHVEAGPLVRSSYHADASAESADSRFKSSSLRASPQR
jgi:lipoate synthase